MTEMAAHGFVSIDNFEHAGARIDSPMTLEAIFSLGIDAADLYPKTELDLLEAAGYKKHIAKVLLDHYEARRQVFVGEVKQQRARLKEAHAAGRTRGPADGALAATASRASHDGHMSHTDALRSTSLENERKRAEFAKQRQQEEMATMIENELKLAKTAEAATLRERERLRKDAEDKATRDRERKKELEARRKAELGRLEEANARVEAMRKAAQEAFAEESERAEKEAAEYKKLLLRRRAAEDDRRRAQEEADRRKEVRGS